MSILSEVFLYGKPILAQVRKFLKYAGINDFARQRRSNFKEPEVQTYELTEQVIKRVRVKFVSGAAGPERHEWFWASTYGF